MSRVNTIAQLTQNLANQCCLKPTHGLAINGCPILFAFGEEVWRQTGPASKSLCDDDRAKSIDELMVGYLLSGSP
jgi:hypothetical protein